MKNILLSINYMWLVSSIPLKILIYIGFSYIYVCGGGGSHVMLNDCRI